MNRRSKRFARNLLVLVVVLAGTLLALPTFFPVDPVIRVGNEDGSAVDGALLRTVSRSLDDAARPARPPELEDGAVRLRFPSIDAQLRAGDELKAALPGHVVAFNLEPRIPRWLAALGLGPVTLGLDLRGGLRFVYEVLLDAVSQQLLQAELDSLRTALRQARLRADSRVERGSIRIELRDPADAAAVRRVIRGLDGAFRSGPAGPTVTETERAGRLGFAITPPRELVEARRESAMEQNVLILRNRVNALGVSESVVERQGADLILVEVPGVQDPAQLDRVLGSTATLEWRLDDMEHDPRAAARAGRPPPGTVLRYQRDGAPVLLQREVIASGEQLTDASFGYSQGRPAVFVRLDGAGARRMRAATLHNVGKALAVVFIEEKRELVEAGSGRPEYRPKREETVIFNGRIDDVLSNRFVLAGLAPAEAKDLALLLRAGALAAPLFKVDSGAVSPTLGRDNIAKGRLALVAGFLAVVTFMAALYRVFGLIADVAVLANLVIVIGLLSLLQAALTLPGMAGIVLTVGMAVDANVLIFERIREELARGRSPLASIEEGYDKAFATIADSNVTTLIAGAVLFVFGTGPIKGFAVTLSLGILTSMFTAVVGTRAMIDLLYRGRAPQRLSIGGAHGRRKGR